MSIETAEGTIGDQLDPEVTKEIDAAIETAMEARKPEAQKEEEAKAEEAKAEEAKAEEAAEAEQDAKEEAKEEAKEAKAEADLAKVGDELFARAIKAGFSASDVRSFKDVAALERLTGVLEQKAQREAQAKGGDSPDGKDAGDDDPLAGIPDLNPEEFDDNLVAVVKGLKDIIRAQHAQLKAIGSEGESRWWDGKVGALGDEHAGKTGDLKRKFDILSAGYKAAGENISKDDLFDEAVSLVLGDISGKSKSEARAENAARRAGQHLARPSGVRVKPASNAKEDIAAEVDREFYGRK